jgi:hypothetical protein
MKTLLTLTVSLVLAASFARAEDWKTTDGQSYQDVKVLSHDDGYVMIMYADGGARVPLSTLPADLQQRFGYDPVKAAAAVAATMAADEHDRDARRQEGTGTSNIASVTPNPAMASTPAASTPPANVMPVRAPAQNPKPSVDVFGNNIKIEDDQAKLDSLTQDMVRAQRDAAQEDAWNHTGETHYDNSGIPHPNRVGESGDERIAEIQKQQASLQAEIDELKKENGSVAQAGK